MPVRTKAQPKDGQKAGVKTQPKVARPASKPYVEDAEPKFHLTRGQILTLMRARDRSEA